MQLDDWTVLGAVVAPYAPYLLVAWEKNRLGVYDPANPRDSNAVLEGWSARAKAAELNSWEALTAYLAIAWIARTAGVDPQWLGVLGVLWLLSRAAYLVAYVTGRGRLRIWTWFAGVALLLARAGLAIAA
ncbi:MAG: MAPEG family protein [Myxococcales bacterium]|nr:MAPEG family protein [Myxococcales bacterium]